MLGGKTDILMYWAILFSFFESLLVLLVVVLFSLITNTVMSVIYTICIYVVGYVVSEVYHTTFIKMRPGLIPLLDGIQFLFPNFSKLNLKPFVLYEQSMSFDYISSACVYVMIYSLAVLLACSFIFEKKNLD